MKSRLIAAAAAMAMAAGTGCSSAAHKTSSETPLKGGYVEEDAFSFVYQGSGAPGAVSATPLAGELIEKDGKVWFSDQLNLRFYTETADFRSFDKEQYDISLGDELASVTRSADGRVFAVKYKMSNTSDDAKNIEGLFVNSDGTTVSADYPSKDALFFCDAEFGSDEQLYFIDMLNNKLIKADPETGRCEEAADTSAEKIDAVGDYMLISSPDSSTVQFYDTKSGEIIDCQKALSDFWQKNIVSAARSDYDICEGEDGTIYIVCSEGIFRYVLDGNKVEQLCSGEGKRLRKRGDVLNNCDIKSIVMESSDSFLVSFSDGVMKRYRYDENCVEEEVKKLKIYSFEYNQLCEKAISWFTHRYPDVSVIEEEALEGLSYDDNMKNLITEIMSDDPPDIIFLDWMDIKNLSEKNVLADLSGCRDKWYPENDELFDNIVEWNKTDDGKLYSVAGGFAVPYIMSDGSEDISAIESFKDYTDYVGKRVNDEEPMLYLPKMEEDTAWKMLYFDAYKQFEQGTPDKDALIAMLESAKNLTVTEEQLENRYSGRDDYDKIAFEYEYSPAGCGMTLDSIEKLSAGWRFIGNSAGLELLIGSSPVSAGFIFNYQYDYETIVSVNEKFKDEQLKMGDLDGGSFMPMMNMGICSRSNNQEMAQEFLRSALSYLPQTQLSEDGIPVNIRALKDNLVTDKGHCMPSLLGSVGEFGMGDGKTFTVNYRYPTDEELQHLIDISKGLKKPILYDRQTHDMLTGPIVKYLKGDMTAEQAAEKMISGETLRAKE